MRYNSYTRYNSSRIVTNAKRCSSILRALVAYPNDFITFLDAPSEQSGYQFKEPLANPVSKRLIAYPSAWAPSRTNISKEPAYSPEQRSNLQLRYAYYVVYTILYGQYAEFKERWTAFRGNSSGSGSLFCSQDSISRSRSTTAVLVFSWSKLYLHNFILLFVQPYNAYWHHIPGIWLPPPDFLAHSYLKLHFESSNPACTVPVSLYDNSETFTNHM
ncbi:hypothetical protein KQX54_017144 [Cotesia glomerata]|uniref:Uncharacterized protein n=1 Tax=Cotesia glomerata TaxID=32391 RepID=A0AAV7IG09_COTGL|nr:hypothetical protein KQX54_017144 [Cotesia glomerata]